MLMTDTIDDATKKVKNTEQDARAKAETTEDHAEGKPSSETLNKAKEKVKLKLFQIKHWKAAIRVLHCTSGRRESFSCLRAPDRGNF